VLPPAVWQLLLKKCYHDLSETYFCGYFVLSKGQNCYLHNTNIWGNFWPKFGYLTRWGDPIVCYHLLFGHSF
jgi:hypothetical protein